VHFVPQSLGNIMSILDKINEIEARITELQEVNVQANKRMQAESDQIDVNELKIEKLRDSIAPAKMAIEEYETKIAKEKAIHAEAFRVLRDAVNAGTINSEDLDVYAESCGLPQPEADEEGATGSEQISYETG
jgi:chromosome segregation ATPase